MPEEIRAGRGCCMIFTIPLPPSANRLTRHVMSKRGPVSISSQDYRTWRQVAGNEIYNQWNAQGCPEILGPWQCHIRVNVDRKSDIDNRVKAALDAVVSNTSIKDDRWCDKLTIERDRAVTGCVVQVEAMA